MKFLDHAKIYVKAGDGGHGCIAFLREKHRPKGGPSGGDGGNGGDIIFIADSQLSTLQDLSYSKHYKAERGQHGQGNNKHGKNGNDIYIKVPCGTIVKDSASDKMIVDLVNHSQKHIIAKGGNGGFGNARFKTKAITAPRIANDGQNGEEKTIELELKVIADVGLVGFPNAGKSTLISKISNSRPKIADYPFTTLVPNLGIVKYDEFNSFVVADIPGLIEGASSGKGLGNQFLRHIERTKILVYLVDIDSKDIFNDYELLKKELEKHNSNLIERPSLLLITKLDLLDNNLPDELLLPNDIEVLPISSINNFNLNKVVNSIADKLNCN